MHCLDGYYEEMVKLIMSRSLFYKILYIQQNGILILPVILIFIALLYKCVIIELPIHGKSNKKRSRIGDF